MEGRLIIDIIIVLDRLGFLAGEEQSPSPDLSTYQTMVDTWRHTTKSSPTEAEMLIEWNIYLAERASTKYLTDREAAMQKLFPGSMVITALLEQARVDRDGGKTLEPTLEAVVNTYDQILMDNPRSGA